MGNENGKNTQSSTDKSFKKSGLHLLRNFNYIFILLVMLSVDSGVATYYSEGGKSSKKLRSFISSSGLKIFGDGLVRFIFFIFLLKKLCIMIFNKVLKQESLVTSSLMLQKHLKI